MKKTLVTFLIIFSFKTLFSQVFLLGLKGGMSTYNGEVNPLNPFTSPSYSIGLIYQHLFSDRFILRIEGNYINLRGSDLYSKNEYQLARNYFFSNSLWDLGLLGEINFLNFNTKDFNKFYWTPYMLIGTKLLVVPDAYTTFDFSLPVGFGLKYLLTKKIVVGIEWVTNWTNSDELDLLVRDNYQVKQRSDNSNNDLYHLFNVFMSFNLYREIPPCPGMRY